MLTRRSWLLCAVFVVLFSLSRPVSAADRPIQAIASFSILADMVRQVGGDRVEVKTLVDADADAHTYQPIPADVRAVGSADIVFVNGLGFEGWIDRLIKASGFKGPVVVASQGVTPIAATGEDHHHHHGHAHAHKASRGKKGEAVPDPHAWQSLANGAVYVRNIAAGLSAIDPTGAAAYQANADRYLAEITALDEEVRQAIAALPPERRKVVTSHEAFAYFEHAYGLDFVAPAGVSTEADVSAKDVARLIEQIRRERIPAVFVENISDPRLMDQIRRETGAAIGGALYSDALSPPDGPAATYLDMFRHNIRALTAALAS
jgi:zinc/manganese transport system substrate-binding protein